MNGDLSEETIRAALNSRADQVKTGYPPIEALSRRAERRGTVRRLRWYSVGVAGLVVLIGATSVVGLNNRGDNGLVAGDPTTQSAPISTPSPEQSVGPNESPDAELLEQLADSPEVQQYLLGSTHISGLVLCGMNQVGSSGDAKLYVWLECGEFTRGPGAKQTSGGADPVLLTVRETNGGESLVSVEFPPMGYGIRDLEQLFPPSVATLMLRGPLPVTPDESARSQVAADSGS